MQGLGFGVEDYQLARIVARQERVAGRVVASVSGFEFRVSSVPPRTSCRLFARVLG